MFGQKWLVPEYSSADMALSNTRMHFFMSHQRTFVLEHLITAIALVWFKVRMNYGVLLKTRLLGKRSTTLVTSIATFASVSRHVVLKTLLLTKFLRANIALKRFFAYKSKFKVFTWYLILKKCLIYLNESSCEILVRVSAWKDVHKRHIEMVFHLYVIFGVETEFPGLSCRTSHKQMNDHPDELKGGVPSCTSEQSSYYKYYKLAALGLAFQLPQYHCQKL